MPADSMTKADPSAGNDALRHLLRTGKLVWRKRQFDGAHALEGPKQSAVDSWKPTVKRFMEPEL